MEILNKSCFCLQRCCQSSLSEGSIAIVRLIMFVSLHMSNHFKCCFTFLQGWTRLPDSILQTRCVACACHKMPPVFAISCTVYVFNKSTVSHVSVIIVVIGHFKAKFQLLNEVVLFLDLTVVFHISGCLEGFWYLWL